MLKKTIYILVLSAITACGNKQENRAATEETKKAKDESSIQLTADQYKNAELEAGQLEERSMHTTVKVNGSVEVPPENIHTISFPMGGYIKSSKLIPGMQVRKGTLLATIEDQSFIQLQQDYLSAKAKLTFAKADYERQDQLNKSQSNSQRVFQQAVADYESQKVLVKALAEKLLLIGINPERLTEANLSRTVNIYAPINSYVSKVNVNPGKYVSPTDILVELIDPSEVHIDLLVFENDSRNLKPGQEVTCFTNADPDQKLPAKIEYITHNLNENRAIEVHCHLLKPVKGLLPGNYVSAEIHVNNQQVKAVPNEALISWQGKSYIFQSKDQKTFNLKQVETGATTDGFTEIKNNLPSELIVTKNAYALLTMLKNRGED